MFSKVHLLGIAITISPRSDILNHIKRYLDSTKRQSILTIVTPNPEQIVEAQNNPYFRNILNQANVALPDGIGVVWGLKREGVPPLFKRRLGGVLSDSSFILRDSITRIPGIEFMEELVKVAAEKNYPVALIGGRAGVVQKALENLQRKYPGLKGWAETPPELRIMNYELGIRNQDESTHPDPLLKREGVPPLVKRRLGGVLSDSSLMVHDSPESNYFNQLAHRIKESGVKLVFVGLGAPKQEYFIKIINYQLSIINYNESLILMSVGGAFDILSGKIPRVPAFMSQIQLEWLWRLLVQPWRIGRQFKLLHFIYLVLRAKFVLYFSNSGL